MNPQPPKTAPPGAKYPHTLALQEEFQPWQLPQPLPRRTTRVLHGPGLCLWGLSGPTSEDCRGEVSAAA